jgi:hypothetical protein
MYWSRTLQAARRCVNSDLVRTVLLVIGALVATLPNAA